MIENAIRAAKLDLDFYNAVEHDESLTSQAGAVVVIVSILSALGLAFVSDRFFAVLILSVVGGLVGWWAFSAITAFIGTRFFEGDTNTGEMLRVIGFAQAPRAIGIVPFLGWVALIWSLVASVVAVREGQDFTTGKAIATVVIGWVVLVILSSIWWAIIT